MVLSDKDKQLLDASDVTGTSELHRTLKAGFATDWSKVGRKKICKAEAGSKLLNYKFLF